MNQTLQPLSPPSDDGPAASHPQGEPFEGMAFPSGEGVFVEGPGSSGRPRWDPPSAVAWQGQPGPSLLGSSCTVWPAEVVPTWSVHAGRGRVAPCVFWNSPKPGAEEGGRGSQSRGMSGQGGGSGTGRWAAWGPGLDVLCGGSGQAPSPSTVASRGGGLRVHLIGEWAQ